MNLWVSIRRAAGGLGLAAFVATAAADPGAKAPPARIPDKPDFGRDVRPILSGKCFQCHGPDESTREAGLRLDLRAEAVSTRDGIIAIKPGDPKKSEIIARITTKDTDDLMPPPKSGHPLTAYEIEVLQRWVQQGAPYAEHWSFIQPERPALPKVKNKSWPHNGLDYFVLARLEKEGLKPSPVADRYTLIRRLSIDLTGLPPTPEEVAAFVNDKSRDAYEKLVDHLLAAPAYGERWARVWLDLARYADSAGYGSDPLRMNIWPYRDWVINAFNKNLPYDRFTLEQIAGDLLPDATDEQRVATAFHRNTMTNTEGGTDDEEFRVAAVKDRIATTSQVWMGLTMGCAQCHSHKFDPISQKEYYSFFAIFNQTEDTDLPTEYPTIPLPTAEEIAKTEKLKLDIAAQEQVFQQDTPELQAARAAWEKSQANGIAWRVVEPKEMKSSGGATLTRLSDGSVLVSGTLAETDTYTLNLEADLTGVTAMRLEVLPDESLPKQGPGRAEDGRFVLTSFKVSRPLPKMEMRKARYVRVELPGDKRMLSLAEVQVFSAGANVALKGKATQSSTDFEGLAGNAIDGNTNGDYFKAKSTTHTSVEDNPWWEVDLGAELPVEEIRIWNRTDGGLGTRLSGFKVRMYDTARKNTYDNTVPQPPSPNVTLNLRNEQFFALQNPTADFSQENFGVANVTDQDIKSGWSTGNQNGKAHEAVFEIGGKMAEGKGPLTIVLEHAQGKKNALGKFRLSFTTQPKPVRFTPPHITAMLAVAADKRTPAQKQQVAEYFREIAPALETERAKLARLKKDLENIKPVQVPVMRELVADKHRSTTVLLKGNFLTPGDPVTPGLPAAFSTWMKPVGKSRLDVARWLTAPENPLTSRVAVNRFWGQIFGLGLVETEEDFGTQGQLPTHPELLDWLAVTFESAKTPATAGPAPGLGWDVKALVKLIVMSATYQQASVVSPEASQKDPRNRLLSHYPRRRLDAEAVRDQALALSGLLSHKIGGPSVYPPQPDGLWRAAFNGQRTWSTSKGEDRYRRGLYTFWRRTVPYPSMATFDAPSRENCTVRRLPTNTPLQAFVTLNDPAFVEMAQALGRRLMKEGGATPAERARYGLCLALTRPPTDAQVKALTVLYEQELANYRANTDAAKKLATEPLGDLPEGTNAAEAAAWTVVGNVLLNLDGVLTKG